MNSRLLKAQSGSEPEVGRAGGGLGAGAAPPSAVLASGLELSVQNPSLPGFNSYVGVLDGEVLHSSTLAWKIPWMEEPGRP